jgi:hypothetical protein
MRPLSFVAGLILLAAPCAAQRGDQPNLVLTLFGGVVAGHSLWTIDRQPLCVYAGGPPDFPCSTVYDTLRLRRDVTASIMAGASATYFASPHVGFEGEFYFLGLPYDDSCSNVVPYTVDPEFKNEQVCDEITRAGLSTSAIAFFAAVIVRGSPARAFSPFVRAGVGLVTYSGGSLEMSGLFQQNGAVFSRAVIVDDKPKNTSLSAQLGAGFIMRISPGYGFRFELRDALIPLQQVTGPANNLALAPHVTRMYHHLALTLGVDVVLERKRGRRY